MLTIFKLFLFKIFLQDDYLDRFVLPIGDINHNIKLILLTELKTLK